MKPLFAVTALTLLGCVACQRGAATTGQLTPPTPNPGQLSNQIADSAQDSAPDENTAQQTSTAAPTPGCDVSQAPVPLAELSEYAGFAAQNLYFRPHTAKAESGTLVFENSRYTFTFCQADRSWSVQPTLSGTEETAALDDPEAYIETSLAGQVYQAKAQLSPDQTEVVFELQLPDSDETIVQMLYDQDKLQRHGFGAELGYPFISKAVAHDGALWWAINFEQGEGWSGLATIVQYQPDSEILQVWQPEALDSARIMDMVITGNGNEISLWLGTQYSGEGNPEIPAKGLVAYLPRTGEVVPYTVDNSPLVGAIPSTLLQIDDRLWAATANGVCNIPLETPGQYADWDCWRFTAEAALPTGGVPLHQSVLAEEPITILSGDTVEVLWASYTDAAEQRTPDQRRYEVRYERGFTTTLDQGAEVWADYTLCEGEPLCGFFWAGREWHWNGTQFVRSHDEVAVNYIGGGPQGMGDHAWTEPAPDWQVMRGDFDLLSLDASETRLRHYSGWVNAADLNPYVTVVPASWQATTQPNPLFAIKDSLPVQGE